MSVILFSENLRAEFFNDSLFFLQSVAFLLKEPEQIKTLLCFPLSSN